MFPNAIIAGAPRCGTTSLFEYLAAHPEVNASSLKETCFFIDQDYFSDHFFQSKMPNYFSHTINEYEKYFSSPSLQEKIILEATPDYLYQDIALEQLASMPTKPRVIFVLRKPSERVYSMYKFAQGQLGLIDKSMTFRMFMNAVRETNEFDYKGYRILADVVDNGKYIQYLMRFVERCDRGRVLIYLFEDMTHDPKSFMKKVADDIGIDGDFYDTFEAKKINESVLVRSKLFQHVIKKAPIPMSLRLGDSFVKRFFRKIYLKLNTAPKSIRDADVSAVLRDLDDEYRDSILALEQELCLDLTNWKR